MSKNQQIFKFARALVSKKYLLIIPFILVTLGLTIMVNQFVTAQSATQGLEVSPPSQEVSIDPGGRTTITAKITNKSNATLPIEVRIEDFTAKGEEGQVELSTNTEYGVGSWTKLSTNSFSLEPGESQEVTATITAPANAAGGRFGSFVFAVKPDAPQPGTAALSQQIASLFLVKVSGPVDEKLDITSFSAPKFSEFGPVTFDIKFANGGNVHIKPYGLINVTDMFGRKVEDVLVPGVNIFPQADRVLQAEMKQRFLIGRYSATALMYYGADNQMLTATTTFYVFPLRVAFVIAAILAILYLMRKRLRKSMKALFG